MTEHIFWVSDPVADRTDFVRAWCSCNGWEGRTETGEGRTPEKEMETLERSFTRHKRGALAEAERRRRIEETMQAVEKTLRGTLEDGKVETIMAQFRTGEKQEHEFLISRILIRETGESYLMSVCSCQRWKATKNFGEGEKYYSPAEAVNWLEIKHADHVGKENDAEERQARLVENYRTEQAKDPEAQLHRWNGEWRRGE